MLAKKELPKAPFFLFDMEKAIEGEIDTTTSFIKD